MKPYLLLILIIFSVNRTFAQGTTKASAVTDTTEKPKTSLTLAALYGSNVSYYGQVSSEKLPFTLGYAKLRFPTGFYLSAQMYKLLNTDAGFSGASASAGYGFQLSKNLSGDLSYSRAFFPDSSRLLQSANQDVVSAALNFEQWLTTGLSVDYALGSENALYSTLNFSKYLDLGLSLSSKDYFTLEPSFELVWGDQQFGPVEEELSLKKILKRNKRPATSSTEFRLISYSFSLPLAYNRSNYSLEASYQGTVLRRRSIRDSQKLQSFFNLGFYYIF